MTPLPAWEDWVSAVASGVAAVPDGVIARAAEILLAADVVLCAGNGGSASLASHAAQAVAKPSYEPGGKAAVCLTDHTPTITAHANDGGWNDALAESARPFLDRFGARCAVVAVSSSGRSENVCRLARLARDRGAQVVALTGFDGDPMRSLATVALHVPSHDYEVVEPVHDALIHRIQQHLRARL